MIYLALVDGLYNIGYCKNKEEIENKIFDSVEDCEEYEILDCKVGTHKELKEIYKTLKDYRFTGLGLIQIPPKDGLYRCIEHFLPKMFPDYKIENSEKYTLDYMIDSFNQVLIAVEKYPAMELLTDTPNFKRYIILENGVGRVNIEQLKQDLL